jgi:hypothetical protein
MASKPMSEGRRNALAAFAFVALAVASTTARADSIFDLFMPDANPFIVQNNITRWGFVQHSALARRGDVYLCDVVDRFGAPQRLIIDARSGRILERYAMRPYAWGEAGRYDSRPRIDTREWGSVARPEVDVPVTAARPNVIESFPGEAAPDYNRVPRQRQLAYGEGHAATPAPESKPIEKPKLKLAHPKHLPAPTPSDLPETATATPSAVDPAVQPPSTAMPQATPAMQQPASETPAASGVVASTGAAAVPAPKAPPAPSQPPKTKAINDIPVAPLD